mmetsp:Transcript_118460/g.334973  ORF Transcript_118460/g.334973 Transcript_118460/m.334973 type:complete len:232 (+) Transcript_118460:763-1458(+)
MHIMYRCGGLYCCLRDTVPVHLLPLASDVHRRFHALDVFQPPADFIRRRNLHVKFSRVAVKYKTTGARHRSKLFVFFYRVGFFYLCFAFCVFFCTSGCAHAFWRADRIANFFLKFAANVRFPARRLNEILPDLKRCPCLQIGNPLVNDEGAVTPFFAHFLDFPLGNGVDGQKAGRMLVRESVKPVNELPSAVVEFRRVGTELDVVEDDTAATGHTQEVAIFTGRAPHRTGF